MTKIKHWIIERVLPVWAKAGLLEENEKLKWQVDKLQAELAQKNAYIAGLESGIRSQRPIVIYNGEVKK